MPCVVALGSFLLFTAELMLSKHLLPLFGGSASVWTGALMFFTALLVVGYAYAAWITRQAPQFQRVTQALLVVASVLWAPLLWWIPPYSISLVGVVGVLAVWIALPFTVLATGASLMHSWYPAQSYRLYAVSNVGSFAALVLFPFVFEPLITWPQMRIVWIGAYIAWCCAVLLLSRSPRQLEPYAIVKKHSWRWITLAALPTALLASATAYGAQIIAPMPLVWMLPLAAYLGSFVVAFAGFGNTSLTGVIVVLIAGVLWSLDPAIQSHVLPILGAVLGFIFFASVRIHAHLYAQRPPDASASWFYLCLAAGGFLGTATVGVVCPILFSDYFELPLLVAAATALFVAWLPLTRGIRLWVIAGTVVLIPVGLATFLSAGRLGIHFENPTLRTRNFYGVSTVAFVPQATVLLHGRTLHGMQLTAPDQKYLATTYYSGLSGVGRAIQFERSRQPALSVGIVGLGVGTLAVYCTARDVFTFYEIDSHIVSVATTEFSFLSLCPQATTAVGDARISLTHAPAQTKFDLLVLDAFDGDAIPIHLLTREALQTYSSHMVSSTSIIAFHISNRMLDLAPQVLRLAQDGGYASMVIRDEGNDAISAVPTVWVLLARDGLVFKDGAFAGTDSYPPPPAERVWTDEYASVLSALRW